MSFAFSKRVLSAKKNAALHDYLKQAEHKISFYLKQNERRLTYPELFTPLQPPAIAKSPLHWEAKKSDFFELIIALDNLDIISENGIKAPYSHIVREFSRIVNIPIVADIHNERKRILSRSTRQTVFIDRLKREGFKNNENFFSLNDNDL